MAMGPTTVRPFSDLSASGSAAMSSTQLPALTFDGNDLRIVLVPNSDDEQTIITDRPQSSIAYQIDQDAQGHEDHGPAGKDIPTHPIPTMQAAFDESILEATHGDADPKPKLRQFDAKARRERLLEQPAEADPFDAAWRYRPGQQQHEVYKLIAQIAFGVFLLLNGLAVDNSQVVAILQDHIDEVDDFLEVMLEDFAQAKADLTERIAHLQLPMANRRAFEEMLEDRNFRAKILAGNERIDHILARTNAAMKLWDDDIDSGLRSSESFMDWLTEHQDASWRRDSPDLNDIFEAMKGNADGWLNAFDQLNNQAQDLNGLVIKLMTIVAEMEKTAGEVSRKTWATIPPFTLPVHTPNDDDASSTASPRSDRSNTKSTPRASLRSGGSASTLQPSNRRDSEEDSLSDFPLPGSTPLLPPPRAHARTSRTPSAAITLAPPAVDSRILKPVVHEEKEVMEEKKPEVEGLDDGPLFILQPKTYTPQASPLPSPMVKDVPSKPFLDRVSIQPQPQPSAPVRSVAHTPSPIPTGQAPAFQQKRASLRDRVSLKTTPPESIHIPPINAPERQSLRPSTAVASPQTAKSQAHDSAYGSDGEPIQQQHRLPRAVSHADFSVPTVRPPLMPSPRSDHQQFYHPVRASPHSPLQQRPHTAVPAEAQHRQPSGYYPSHQRNQPSRMGGMSTLSSVTMATCDDGATMASGTTSHTGGRRVKKKRSAFGWLKKAFTLDDSEKAEYQARRVMQYPDQYYDPTSPKFLDGKRVR